MWFGSVADALVRQSHIPILLLRPTEESSDPNGEPVTRRVLVPLDGSQLAEQALEPALSLGGAEGEFTLLRVIPLVNPVAYDPTTGISGLSTAVLHELQELKRRQEAESHEYLLQLAERLRARTANVRTQLATHEHPAIAILDTAAKFGVDAIAMTTRGRGGVKRLLLGSVADKVLRGATTPVLISAPPGGADLVQGTSEPSH
jgi:nucleotide-binding universal stress UspA family protein